MNKIEEILKQTFIELGWMLLLLSHQLEEGMSLASSMSSLTCVMSSCYCSDVHHWK